MTGSTEEPSSLEPGETLSSSTPPTDDSTGEDEVRARIAQVTAQVPWIGSAWRWYDVPYRLCAWLLRGWRRRLVPRRLRQGVTYILNFFIPFNAHQRNKVEPLDDPSENLVLPANETVRQGGIWVVDFYPPSEYDGLLRSLRRNGWDQGNPFRRIDGTIAEQVEQARSGQGFVWYMIRTITTPDSSLLAPGAKREQLPSEFALVEIAAVQVGPGLTALACFFRLSEEGQTAVDTVWRQRHEPRLHWMGLRQRPHSENRYFAGIRNTQEERLRLHDLARRWLAQRCPGYFARQPGAQPVIDLTLFSSFDPELQEPSRPMGEGLRALGLADMRFDLYTSPDLPGITIIPGRFRSKDYDVLHNYWSLVGQFERVADLEKTDGPARSAAYLAQRLDDHTRALLLYVACERYLADLRASYSRARDLARQRHGHFRPKGLRRLRQELLTTSLDLRMVSSDLAILWDPHFRKVLGINVVSNPAPGYSDRPGEDRSFDLIERLGELRTESVSELLSQDAAYRDVLVTVASLGSTLEASRMGRLALWVAAASLCVAVGTLLITTTGDDSLWSHLVHWMR